jgi:hypothetical protein
VLEPEHGEHHREKPRTSKTEVRYLLLHELGHMTGRFGNDAGYAIAPLVNKAYSQLVLQHCF